MAETVQQLLRERAEDDNTAVRYGEESWTWREHVAESSAVASALIGVADADRPMHVGTLLGNSPDMLRAMAAAALGGYTLCGINNTRRGEGLLKDLRRAECQILVTDAEHRPLLDGPRPRRRPGAGHLDTDEWADLVAGAGPLTPLPRGRGDGHVHDDLHLRHQRRPQGRAGQPPDGALLRAQPAGPVRARRPTTSATSRCRSSTPTPSSPAGAPRCAAAPRSCRRSSARPASSPDVRKYGVTYMNYVGKPLAYVLATPELPDDADNTLRVAFGNEASDRDIDEFMPPVRLRRVGRLRLHRARGDHHPRAGHPEGLDRQGLRRGRDLQLRDDHRVRGRGLRRERRARQRRRGDRRAGEHPGLRLLQRLLQRQVRQRRADAARHVLVRRPRLPRRRRLDLPRRPHRRLDAGRRREPRRRPDRAGPAAAATRSTGSRSTPSRTSTSATR